MNRNSGNVSKTKKLILGATNNSKPNRKAFKKASESSSLSSNVSSAQSEEEVRVKPIYSRPQVNNNDSYEEQEQIMKKLQAQVKELKHKLRVLEESVDSKDYSLGTIAREKDRAVGEIRRLERSNKQLRQQLSDERTHYLEEKEKFCEEMTRYKKRLQELKTVNEGKNTKNTNWNSSKQSLINQSLKWQFNKEKGDFTDNKNSEPELKSSKSQNFPGNKSGTLNYNDSYIKKAGSLQSFHLYEGDDMSLQMAALKTENAKLRNIICERDERNYELCLRFLRMKHYKNDIRSRFQDLENEYLQVIANLMDKIDEARQEFNFIIDQKFKKPLHSTNAMYLQLVQRNSRMAFENASLRLENQCLKKELNKYLNGVAERKMEELEVEKLDDKMTIEEKKSDSKLKRIKKNVNFKEIRTIYERQLPFKVSDTDSNYMSKTSTTVPSSGSLGNLKSNENILNKESKNVNSETKVQENYFANTIPSEILHKIFKRIDSSSCQSLENTRRKDSNSSENANKIKTDSKKSNNSVEKLSSTTSQKTQEESSAKQSKEEQPTIEYKTSLKVLESSSPAESKESVRFGGVVENSKAPAFTREFTPYEQKVVEPENIDKEEFQRSRTKGYEKSKSYRNRVRVRTRGGKHFYKDEEENSFALPVNESVGLGRNERVRSAENRARYRTRQFRDSCGLEEKIEMSHVELPITVESKIQTVHNSPETDTNNTSEQGNPRVVIPESDDDEILGRERWKVSSNTMIKGSRSRSANKLNLRDELMEAARRHIECQNPFWKEKTKIQSNLSQNTDRSYRFEKEDAGHGKGFKDTSEPIVISPDSKTNQGEPDITYPRKTEGSKRFSQRLISTSPEQLKNLLTESQFGSCYRMAPIIVGHATTEVNSAFSQGDANNEIVLQLVIPTATINQNPPGFTENGTTNLSNSSSSSSGGGGIKSGGVVVTDVNEKKTVEKETSMSGLGPVKTGRSSNQQADVCSSDIKIPVSSLQTSSSTMEMVDPVTANDRNSVILRTLSAPGLLESSWLDPYTVCEMRDCGTNT